MADVSPFRGVHFNLDKAGDPSTLISPPYDIISPQQRRVLHEVSSYNFVRLVFGEEHPWDSDSDNRFTRAGEFLRNWMESGILVQDEAPGLYRQRIQYSVGGQTKRLEGLVALVNGRPYEDGIILPHEKTLQGPKEGLARLMESTGGDLDCVWLMYEDNAGQVRDALQGVAWEPVVPEAVDQSGVRYGLDRCSDTSRVQAITQALADEQMVIADGHHRYETALSYSARQDELHPGATDRPWQWVMATLVWTDDPGLTVLPTHRVVREMPPAALDSIPARLANRFELTPVREHELGQELDKASDPVFAIQYAGQAWVARPKQQVDAIGAELVQQCILADILGFDIAHLKTDPRIAYVEDMNEAQEMVHSGDYQAAFLLKPVPIRTITRYARDQRCLPQKSTYFYPKLASGLVLRLIVEESAVAS